MGKVCVIILSKKTNPLQLIDFGGVQIFDNATVDTNIIITQKAKNEDQLKGCLIDKTSYNKSSNISTFFRQNAVKLNPKNGWVVMSEIEQQIKAKIEKIGTPLKDWDIQINYGIKTGYNEAFIINKEKRDELIKKSPNSVEVIRPILRGRDIKKYSYNFAELYIIATFPSLKIDIEKYPAVKEHLLSFTKHRLEQTGEKGSKKEDK